MKKIKFYFLIIIAHITEILIKIFGTSSGTSFIGMLMLKFDKTFIEKAAAHINNIITVTGTNGKTTTSGILSHLIKASNISIINNNKGANMLTGIANTLALNVVPFTKFKYAVFESDEAYLSQLYDKINSDYLVVTNLFRDQLDRYGELSTTARKIQKAIDKNRNLQLILNADDPLVVNFKPIGNKKPIYYGFDEVIYNINNKKSNAPAETINCPWCKRILEYNKTFYAQQGHYFCKCGYKRPDCKYSAKVVVSEKSSEITMKVNNKSYKFIVPLVGLYNAYNALAAISLALELNIPDIEKNLVSFKSEFGRSEIRKIGKKEAIIQLIKNPTGASEVLKTVNLDSNILIAINDNYADGRDVSWLWDTDFELLRNSKHEIVTSGTRAYDMAVRLKYAGIKNVKVIAKVNEAINYVKKKGKSNKITVLPSYTALLEIIQKGV